MKPYSLIWAFLCLCLCIPQTSQTQESITYRVSALCDSGITALDNGDEYEAYQLIRQALSIDGNSLHALISMGRILLNVHAGGERAVEYLRRAVIVAPESVEAHYYKVLAHIRMSKTDVGTDNSQFALAEIEKVLALNPSHRDVYYQQGVLFRDTYADYSSAISSFRKQVEVDPGHPSAWIALLKAEMAVGGWEVAVAVAESILTKDPHRLEAYPYLAAAQWKSGKHPEAMQIFDSYFDIIPEKELNLYRDLGLVLSTKEREEFSVLDEQSRQTFWDYYWQNRDPNPETYVHERLLEHYIRIAYARIEFGEHTWPWDDRGAFFIRYGEPDVRSGRGRPYALELILGDRRGAGADWDFHIRSRDLRRALGLPLDTSLNQGYSSPGLGRMTDASGVQMSGSFTLLEEWFYTDLGLHLSFVDPVLNGKYLTANRLLAEAMERVIPSVSNEENRIEYFDLLDYIVTFRGQDNKTKVEYIFALLPDDFVSSSTISRSYPKIDTEVRLFTDIWEPVEGTAFEKRNVEITSHFRIKGVRFHIETTQMEVASGNYRLTAFITELETKKQSTVEELFEVPDYSGDELMVSDILPAIQITEVEQERTGPFIRGSLEVIPLPGRAIEINRPLFIYYETYNLSKDELGATDYRVDYSISIAPYNEDMFSRLASGVRNLVTGEQVIPIVTSSFVRSGIQSNIASSLEIDMSELASEIDRLEIYQLVLFITDNLTGATTSSTLLFRILPDW